MWHFLTQHFATRTRQPSAGTVPNDFTRIAFRCIDSGRHVFSGKIWKQHRKSTKFGKLRKWRKRRIWRIWRLRRERKTQGTVATQGLQETRRGRWQSPVELKLTIQECWIWCAKNTSCWFVMVCILCFLLSFCGFGMVQICWNVMIVFVYIWIGLVDDPVFTKQRWTDYMWSAGDRGSLEFSHFHVQALGHRHPWKPTVEHHKCQQTSLVLLVQLHCRWCLLWFLYWQAPKVGLLGFFKEAKSKAATSGNCGRSPGGEGRTHDDMLRGIFLVFGRCFFFFLCVCFCFFWWVLGVFGMFWWPFWECLDVYSEMFVVVLMGACLKMVKQDWRFMKIRGWFRFSSKLPSMAWRLL